MKVLILLTGLLFSATLSYTQVILPVDSTTNKITYSEVVAVDGNSAGVLYSKVKDWLTVSFKDSKNVLDLDDAINFKIVGKWQFSVWQMGNLGKEPNGGHVDYTLTIMLKDNRYKYIITDFYHDRDSKTPGGYGAGGNLELETPQCGKFFMTMKNWGRIQEQTDTYIKQLVQSLKVHMGTKSQAEGW